VQTLATVSEVLKDNPLGDPYERFHPVLRPVGPEPAYGWPVVLILSGFTGNGPNSFNQKTFESNFPATLDAAVTKGEAPKALYVFCDAMTAWGGSQFLNSDGMGRYEDFVADELVTAIKTQLPAASAAEKWCVTGGSSGGYGALHLASQRPDVFGYAAAIAPDSFFEASLLHEIWTAMPTIQKAGGLRGVQEELANGRLRKRKEAHVVLNVVAMGLCYASDGRGDIEFPIDPRSGRLLPEIWKKWKRHDPVEFLVARAENVSKIKAIYLDVGTRDQFQLQYGTRQIFEVLKSQGANVSYREFEGNHFDIGDRRPEMWKWLLKAWS
jgi:enterochelin esterase-like enzyme